MKASAIFLARHIRYQVPDQNLSIDYRQLPGLPRSGFLIREVQMTGQPLR